jgi:alpha-galactosidase/6-phospho-beta-glucosidase family protein
LLKSRLKDSSISLGDIDPEKLKIMTAFTKRLAEQWGLKPGLIRPLTSKK